MTPGHILITCTLLALLAISVQGQPGPDQCETDPCNGTECSRYLNAQCDITVSQGGCTARFAWKGRDVTDKCQVRTCDSRQCGRNHDCMEEVFPPSCPEDKPIDTCRQYVRSKCVLRPFERPLSCDDIECGEGMMCRFRERPGGFPPVVRCVEARPRDCSELECEEGFTCVMRNRRPVCVAVTTCDQLTCDSGSECIETESGPTCRYKFFGNSCDELNCLEFFAVCSRRPDNYSECTPPRECTPELDARCREVLQVCGLTVDGSTATCLPPSSCEQLECGNGFTCVQSGMNPASCFSTSGLPSFGRTCEDIMCEPEGSCLQQNFPSANLSFATCSPKEFIDGLTIALTVFFQDCSADGLCPPNTICTAHGQDGKSNGYLCVPVECDTIACPPGNLDCISLSTEELPIDFVCSPTASMLVPGSETCSENGRVCPSGTRCAEVYVDGDIGWTICSSQVRLGETCDDLTCTGENEECAVTVLPDVLVAQCFENFAELTEGIRTNLRAFGFDA